MRIFAAKSQYALLAVGLAAAIPRLIVLAVERGSILSAYTEKSDDFARTFVASGTFGFIPGVPSADTQPLYGYFLIPLYWLFGRHWLVVGLAQIAVATATALLVYAIACRLVPRLAALAAIVATLNPYLIWHDVHVNREITDQIVLAGIVLATLLAAERRSTATRVARTRDARTSWSTISRFTWTSCQIRYGFSVAMIAASAARRGTTSRPIP